MKSATDMGVYLLGGNKRTNASIAIVSNNASMTVGQEYSIDISTEAILVAIPNTNKLTGKYEFTYSLSGDEYSWLEKLISGPNGTTYFWVAIGCAAGIGALLLILIIFLIVRCCRRRS